MVMVVMVVVKDDDGDGKEEEFGDVKFLSFFGRRLWRWLAEGWLAAILPPVAGVLHAADERGSAVDAPFTFTCQTIVYDREHTSTVRRLEPAGSRHLSFGLHLPSLCFSVAQKKNFFQPPSKKKKLITTRLSLINPLAAPCTVQDPRFCLVFLTQFTAQFLRLPVPAFYLDHPLLFLRTLTSSWLKRDPTRALATRRRSSCRPSTAQCVHLTNRFLRPRSPLLSLNWETLRSFPSLRASSKSTFCSSQALAMLCT